MEPGAGKPLQRMKAYALPQATQARGTWIRQRGLFLMGRRWLPFTAEERFDAVAPGFEWRARVRFAPFVSVHVVDAFQRDHGVLRARLLGLTVANESGPDITLAECLRLLAELPWCPFAFDHPAFVWSTTDDGLAVRAPSLVPEASVRFAVDASGRALRTEARRQGRIGRRSFVAEWFGEFDDYREFAGMRLPARAQVSWLLPEGKMTYFQCEIVDAGTLP